MPDEMPSLQVDSDWKKQAQAEKRRLAEEAEAAKKVTPATGTAIVAPGGGAGLPAGAAGKAAARGQREMPLASFATLVQSLLTQSLYYLGELGSAGGEGAMNLDLAKHQIDLMGVIDDKTKGNLSADEQKLIDTALYEARMRFVSIASQML